MSNINLKIALLLGFQFNRHGFIYPDSTDFFKVEDDSDYEIFNFKKDPIRTMMKIEKKYNIEFEFMKSKSEYFMYTVNGKNVPDIKNLKSDNMWDLLCQAIDLTFLNDVNEEIQIVTNEYPWHVKRIEALR